MGGEGLVGAAEDLIDLLTTKINALMWDEREGFYYDLDAAEKRLKVKTIASFWPLIAASVSTRVVSWKLAALRKRFGYRRLHMLLRREGMLVNHKRVHRLYREEGLSLRRRKRKRLTSEGRGPGEPASAPNQVWSLDGQLVTFAAQAWVTASSPNVVPPVFV